MHNNGPNKTKWKCCHQTLNFILIHTSPAEFPQKMGQPLKNLYKDVLYTVEKINLWAFQWYIVSFFLTLGKIFYGSFSWDG